MAADGALHKLSDEQMQMLNLSADWLTSFLPHVLTRVSRVHYGLLQPEELRRAYADNPQVRCLPPHHPPPRGQVSSPRGEFCTLKSCKL